MTAARKLPAPARDRPLALIYRRVSSRQQVELGASLDSQATTLIAECDRRGWDWRLVTERGKSAKTMNRPRLDNALTVLDRGHADILLAIRLDRVSRSVVDFGQLLERAQAKGWAVNLLDMNLDMTTPNGKFAATILAAAAQFERELIGLRTAEGMSEKMRQGVLFGRPRTVPQDVVDRIITEARAGRSFRAIGDGLMADEIATVRGGRKWWPTTVRDITQAPTTIRITDPGASDATAAVLEACARSWHPSVTGPVTGPPLPVGVTLATITALGWPDVQQAIAEAEQDAPEGWSAVLAGRPQPRLVTDDDDDQDDDDDLADDPRELPLGGGLVPV